MKKKVRGTVYVYSKALGLSKEGMRFLEEKGILYPQKADGSGYKTYGLGDSMAVVNYKKCRSFGFDVNQTREVLKESDPNKNLETIRRQQIHLEDEIEKKKKVLKSLKKRIERLSRETALNGTYEIVTRPALFWMVSRKDAVVEENELAMATMEKWNTTLSGYADSAIIWTMDRLMGRGGHIYAGQMIEAEDAQGEDIGDVHYSSAVKCLYTIRSLEYDDTVSEFIFDEAIEYIAGEKMRIIGDAVARLLRMYIAENGKYHCIWELMIPISA